MSETDLNRIREGALGRIDKSRRAALGYLIVAAIFEALALVLLFVVMDFDDKTHLVIFLAACLVYGPLAFGLFALRAYIDLSAQRILRAMEASGRDEL